MMTFSELTQRYLHGTLKAKATYANYVRVHAQFFKDWTEHPTRAAIKAWHMSQADHAAHANKALGFLKAMYNWAMNDGLWDQANPALGIKRHPTYSRERVMDLREVGLVLNTLDFLNEKYQAWFLCRLLVPCRIKELCTMKRADIDTYGKWVKSRTKNGRAHTIHIPQQALVRLFALPPTGDYFFMGQYGHALSEDAVRKVWRRWREDLGLSNLWLLDYRRTLATYLYRVQKVDDLTAKAILGHYDSRPVAIYTRLDYDYLATTIQGYADWLMTLKTDTPLYKEVPHASVTRPTAPQSFSVRSTPFS